MIAAVVALTVVVAFVSGRRYERWSKARIAARKTWERNRPGSTETPPIAQDSTLVGARRAPDKIDIKWTGHVPDVVVTKPAVNSTRAAAKVRRVTKRNRRK